jgi:histidine triad (HIT) family protein
MSDCLFCKISRGELNTSFVYQDDKVVAFRDLSPQAPEHFLVIPKKHIATTNDLQPEDAPVVGQLLLVAAQLASEYGFAEAGYRNVLNCNQDGGQSVYHIHLHVLAGRSLLWPPG